MTWTTFHHRGDVLRTVTRTADARRDGILPMDVAGVTETFGDEVTLLGALQLRWHTRLSGHIERELLQQPLDPDLAVIAAWQAAADELPGTRAIVDHYRAEPADDAGAARRHGRPGGCRHRRDRGGRRGTRGACPGDLGADDRAGTAHGPPRPRLARTDPRTRRGVTPSRA